MQTVKSYEDLQVWQKGMEIVRLIYGLTNHFPNHELYGLSAQMRRCAISVPSNIAEGSRRGTRKNFRNFLLIAFGSGAELETQIKIARMLNYCSEQDISETQNQLTSVMRMLNKMIANLQN